MAISTPQASEVYKPISSPHPRESRDRARGFVAAEVFRQA